jgi:uncharacterized protein YgiM (DUF1202 family)
MLFIFTGLALSSSVYGKNSTELTQGKLNQGKVQQGKVVKKTSVLAKPEFKSTVLGEISSEEKISVQTRQRSWYQIISEQGLTGWVKMLNVRFIGVAKRQGEFGLSALVDSVKQTSPTASTGIRGFDEEDLKKAQANFKQLELLGNYQSTTILAKKFAADAKLKTKNLAILTALMPKTLPMYKGDKS